MEIRQRPSYCVIRYTDGPFPVFAIGIPDPQGTRLLISTAIAPIEFHSERHLHDFCKLFSWVYSPEHDERDASEETPRAVDLDLVDAPS